jgi:predicted TIM-barrel fold metal-dependent hydrolase
MKSNYYFNVNGGIGVGCYKNSDYRTAADLLAEMDRLGITQSLAYHVEASDVHPSVGNESILREIRETSGAAGRIFPVFSVSPNMTFVRHEMAQVEDCLARGDVGFLELFPITHRYRLLEIERVLHCFYRYRPVVMIGIGEMNQSIEMPDLATLANKFPEMKFVVKKFMWGQMSCVVDVMYRAENVYADISWLHSRDAIRMMCEQFSYKRLLFGLGFKSHGGAALSALLYAEISQQARDAIAYDNLLSLVDNVFLRECMYASRARLEPKVRNSYWKPFINVQPLPSPVIDAHAHLGPAGGGWYMPSNRLEDHVDILLKDCRQFGLEMTINSSVHALNGDSAANNLAVEKTVGNHKNKIKGYLALNPKYAGDFTEAIIDDFFSRDYFVGMKFLPAYHKTVTQAPEYAAFLRYANKHRLPVLIHTWEGNWGTAKEAAETARKYPDAVIIFGHTGGGSQGRRECEEIAQSPGYDNCVFDFCGSFCTDIEWPDTLKKIDYRRVVFGSDSYIHELAWELGRLLSLDIPDEVLKAILADNMRRILNRRIFGGVVI